MKRALVGLASLGVALAAVAPVSAEIKVTRQADGTILVTNEGSPARRSPAPGRLLDVPSVDWVGWIHDAATARDVDPRLVQSVMQVESGYDPWAVSTKGAMGLMQLMPDTADLLGVDDAFDPQSNIRGGTAYLRRMLDRFDQRIELALAAYNAGPTAVDRYGGIPPFPETRTYVRRVMTLYRGSAPDLDSVAPLAPRTEIFVVRDENDRLVVTTSPGGGG